jgi:hypothetical protein
VLDYLVAGIVICFFAAFAVMPEKTWTRLVSRAQKRRAAREELRRGPWIQTRSGARWYPYTPRAADVHLEDLGACAYVLRFGGHAGVLTVAEHQYRVAKLLEARGASLMTQLLGLLHDAHEVYPPGDVCAPVFWGRGVIERTVARSFRWMSKRAERAVHQRLHLPVELPQSVKHADLVMLSTEAHSHLPGGPKGWGSTLPSPLHFVEGWEPEFAEFRWWQLVRELSQRAADEMKDQRCREAEAGRDSSQGWDTITALLELAVVADRQCARCAPARRGAA